MLNLDALDGAPLTLLDGGVERRAGEAYDYYNGNRTEYGGFPLSVYAERRGCL